MIYQKNSLHPRTNYYNKVYVCVIESTVLCDRNTAISLKRSKMIVCKVEYLYIELH